MRSPRIRGMAVGLLALIVSTTQAFADGRSAYEVWSQVVEALLLGVDQQMTVDGTEGKFTFGAEKEGSSSLITRIMSPKKSAFKSYVTSLSEADRTAFLREFLGGWVSGRYRQREVRDKDGRRQDFDFSDLRGIQWAGASPELLMEKFESWLERAGDRSFSFISPGARQRIFHGKLTARPVERMHDAGDWDDWVALFGDAEKYIGALGSQVSNDGWEINFLPQDSYTEFNRMIDWFIHIMATHGVPFDRPGHQRMVFARRQGLDEEQKKLEEQKLAEVYRMIQAYILIKGYAGRAGMEKSYAIDKLVHEDSKLARLCTERGVIRLEGTRFGAGTAAIELRAGTKTDSTRQFVQQALIARYASGDFSGLASIGDYTLVSASDLSSLNGEKLAERYGVTPEQGQACIDKIKALRYRDQTYDREIHYLYWAPFWGWENAPFIGEAKKQQLRALAKAFIESVASWERPQWSDFTDAFQVWARASNLSADIESYLRPRAPEVSTADLARLMSYGEVFAGDTHPTVNDGDEAPIQEEAEEKWYEAMYSRFQAWWQKLAGKRSSSGDANVAGPAPAQPRGLVIVDGIVDSQTIDLGIEFSARFPLRLQAKRTQANLSDGKRAWITTLYDLTPAERDSVIRGYAETLAARLSPGRNIPVTRVDDGNHGHDLVIAYQVVDHKGRKWRIEWDGVGRTYGGDGEIVAGSARGGHVEVVTPKFVPNAADLNAVFGAFAKNNLIPEENAGGGHINIDLKVFEGRPRAFARFLALFHQYRGVISLMFQHVNRLKSAEPLAISPRLAKALADFQGTEEELKQLLFNERYFNARVGRKSRYVQMDVSAYFQDVIPADLVTDDFDLMNDLWRAQFRVDPRIRKAEGRLFDAPTSAYESALQIKLIRALLHMALNTDSPLSGVVQAVDHEGYLRNPETAYSDLARMANELGLNEDEYRYFVTEGLMNTKEATASAYYQSFAQRIAPHPVVTEGWGRATEARPATQAIGSEGRAWTGAASRAAQDFQAARKRAAQDAAQIRSREQNSPRKENTLLRNNTCEALLEQ